eukprot:c19783_g1_i1 orf=133-3339(+)
MNPESGHEATTNEVAEDAGVEARTVFIRNLPYTFTDSQLQEVFSEIGPVRRSFTVKEKGAEQHRGFGYVQFAVAEDAIRAVEAKDGIDLHGRKVMVKLAKRRLPFEQRRVRKQPNGKSVNEESERLGTSDLEKKAPQKPSTITERQEPISTKSVAKEEVAVNVQRKQDSQHETKTIKRKCESLGSTITEEVGPSKKSGVYRQIEKQEPSDAKLKDRGVAVDAQRKQKRQSDSGENKNSKKEDVLDLHKSKKNKRKDEASGYKKSSEKQRVARTVILGGLVSPEMREAVIECAKKIGPVESIQSSLSAQELKGRGLEKDGCKVGAAAILYTSVKTASQAVAELHQKTIGDGIVWARQLGGEGSKPRKWRIIIRNLPFNVTEEKIRELFASSGFVWEAKVPRKEDGQARGFAFASFTSKGNAEKAIRTMNGKTVQKRPMAVDWAVERSAYEPNIGVETQLKDDTKELLPDMEEDEIASEDEEGFDKEEGSFYGGLENECGGSELSNSIEEIDLAKKVLNRVVSASLDVNLESADSKETGNDLFKSNGGLTSAKEEMKPHTETKPAEEDHNTKATSREDLMKTVFIKNLPFDVDANTLKRHFSAFGKVKSTYLVLHPKTKRPKGTAFLEFASTESAEAALAAAIGTTDDKKFMAGILVGGRKLEVLRAVGKKSAEALEKEKLEHVTVDRRNLYLAKEGKIDGTPAADGVSEQDLQKRRELEAVKATKLRSPNFHVSKTRLAVYNIPKSMNEAEVRKLFIDAVKSRATKQHPAIKQVKILRDEAKGDKSRGVAFVEFTEHQHALVALRVLNNNPETFGSDRRPIVGFAIENLQTLKKRHERQLAAGKTGADESEGGSKVKEKRRREKKLKVSKNRESDGSVLLTSEQGKLDAKEHGDLDSKEEKSAKPVKRNKSRANVTHQEQANGSGMKRKRREDTKLDEDINRIQKLPSSKHRKLSKNNLRRKELEEFKSDSIVGKSKGRLNNKGDSSKQTINGAESWARTPSATLGANNQLKIPKAAQRKKGFKFEVEDKLDKLVAVYREKYFSDVSGGAKEKKRPNATASNDLKRWFE